MTDPEQQEAATPMGHDDTTLDIDVRDLLAELVATESVNPDLVAGGSGESAAADLCGRWLSRRGFEAHRLERRPGRPSVVGVARGSGGGRSLMLNGHLDTVGLDYDGDPLDPVVREGRMHGRGTYDMKGGLAAMMVAAARAIERGLRGDVLVACVADEEFASAGTEEVLGSFTADAAVVTEPSELEVVLAHKGFVWFEVEALGVAAHGSRADLGVDAISGMGHLLVAVDGWGRRLAEGPGHPLLGTGSVHCGVISGGQETSTYPARCTVSIERRTVPGETPDSVEDELRQILDRLHQQVPDVRWEVRRGLSREPFEADPGWEVVQAVVRHAETVLDAPPVVRGEHYWTDCALLAGAGIPALLLGPRGEGAHAATEWVDLDSVAQLARVLQATVEDVCG